MSDNEKDIMAGLPDPSRDKQVTEARQTLRDAERELEDLREKIQVARRKARSTQAVDESSARERHDAEEAAKRLRGTLKALERGVIERKTAVQQAEGHARAKLQNACIQRWLQLKPDVTAAIGWLLESQKAYEALQRAAGVRLTPEFPFMTGHLRQWYNHHSAIERQLERERTGNVQESPPPQRGAKLDGQTIAARR